MLIFGLYYEFWIWKLVDAESRKMFVFLCCLFLGFSVFLHLKPRKQGNPPPSPAALPVIGHLHLLKPAAHRSLRALSKRHGAVMQLYFGRLPVVFVTSPSAAEECFTRNDAVFANRPDSAASRILGYHNTTIGFAPHGEHWRNLRRVTTVHIFSSAALQQTSSSRSTEIRFLIRKMLQSSDLQQWRRVNLKSLFFEFVYNVATSAINGKRGPVMDDMFGPTKILDLCEYFPLLRWIDLFGIKRKFKTLNRRRDGFLQSLIDEARSKIRSSPSIDGKRSYLEALLSMQKAEPEFYTDEILKGLILPMFTAGTHTVALTLEWAMSLLLNHPNELKKARKEIDEKIGATKLLEDSDLQNLPYLRCILNETLRLYPVGPLLVPRRASKYCNVGAFDISRGTILLVNAWAIQRDPSLWNDPESFRPERFRGFEGGNVGFRFVPFGVGRRACPGVGMAMRVMGLALGCLIQCFDWEREGLELVDMEEGLGLTLSKAKALEALCRPRSYITPVLSQF